MKSILLSLLAVPFFAVAVQAQDAKPEKPKMDPAAAFKKMDSNADGSVTLEEFKASPRWKKNADKADEAFKKRDKDSDGKVTLEEFTAKAERPGKAEKPAKPAKEAPPAAPAEPKKA